MSLPVIGTTACLNRDAWLPTTLGVLHAIQGLTLHYKSLKGWALRLKGWVQPLGKPQRQGKALTPKRPNLRASLHLRRVDVQISG